MFSHAGEDNVFGLLRHLCFYYIFNQSSNKGSVGALRKDKIIKYSATEKEGWHGGEIRIVSAPGEDIHKMEQQVQGLFVFMDLR